MNITETWFRNINEQKTNLSVFLDLKKAFDTVDHDVLLSKLSAYGVTDLAHGWFTSYLAGREQYCYVEGKSSNKRLVQCGIPQGSCLGPLLFIIYMNDFFFLYHLKNYNVNLQTTLLYKITIRLYNTTRTIPRGARG